MNRPERRATSALATIYALRMLGLFLILPVFALYAEGLAGTTPVLVGVAIGIYGLTQAALQIPFGMVSDHIGRKPVILFGLALFAAGSGVAAEAESIHGVIAGRALQGAGAIAAAVLALAADLTREESRLRAMAIIGITIGVAFSASLVLGPLLDRWMGVPGLFWLTAVLAVVGMGVVVFGVPAERGHRVHRDAEAVPGQFARVLRDPELLRLDAGIFLLHLGLTATFVALPLVLRDQLALAPVHHGWLYLPVMVIAFAAMVPFIIIAEKQRRMRAVFLGAIAAVAVAAAGLGLAGQAGTLAGVALALLVYFTAFNLLEASLPSLIAKAAPAGAKGTAMGVYSSAQFLGAFTGGVAGGWAHGAAGAEGVFGLIAGAAAVWWLLARGMAPPHYLSSHVVAIPADADPAALTPRLAAVAGVAEVEVVPEEGAAYLKVELDRLDREGLAAATGQPSTA